MWCHRSQRRKKFRREGVGTIAIFQASKEMVIDNSSSAARVWFSVKEWQKVNSERPVEPSSKRVTRLGS